MKVLKERKERPDTRQGPVSPLCSLTLALLHLDRKIFSFKKPNASISKSQGKL